MTEIKPVVIEKCKDRNLIVAWTLTPPNSRTVKDFICHLLYIKGENLHLVQCNRKKIIYNKKFKSLPSRILMLQALYEWIIKLKTSIRWTWAKLTSPIRKSQFLTKYSISAIKSLIKLQNIGKIIQRRKKKWTASTYSSLQLYNW